MQVTIREAQPSDAKQLITYVQRLAEEPDIDIALAPGEFNLTVEEEKQILADRMASDNSIMLVAQVGGQIVGQLGCKGGIHKATHHAVTLGMSVRRGWRNHQIKIKAQIAPTTLPTCEYIVLSVSGVTCSIRLARAKIGV